MARGKKSGGFTLVEIIVVIGIAVLLSSALLLYNSSSRQQIALYAEEAKLVQAAYRAKSLSLSLYSQSSSPDICGYGIHVDARSYYIFSYGKPAGSSCKDISNIDTNLENQISSFSLAPNVNFADPRGGSRFSDILFIPPDPTTVIKNVSGDFIRNGSASIVIQAEDGSLSATISINSSGLINVD